MTPNKLALSELILALHLNPHTVTELVECTGFTRMTVYSWLEIFKRKRLVRIAAWVKVNKVYTPAYEWTVTRLKDAPRPRTHY